MVTKITLYITTNIGDQARTFHRQWFYHVSEHIRRPTLPSVWLLKTDIDQECTHITNKIVQFNHLRHLTL